MNNTNPIGKVAVITGVNGQDGSYLADMLLHKGYDVIGLKRRTSTINTSRIDHLYDHPLFKLHHYDLTDGSSVFHILEKYKPDEFYNLAHNLMLQYRLRFLNTPLVVLPKEHLKYLKAFGLLVLILVSTKHHHLKCLETILITMI